MSRWTRPRARAESALPDFYGVRAREAEVSRQIVEALRALGWRVYNFAADRALPPACAGFPDLVALRPGCPVLFVQVKRPDGGRLSEEQREFAELVCADTGAAYTQASDVEDVLRVLRKIGAIL